MMQCDVTSLLGRKDRRKEAGADGGSCSVVFITPDARGAGLKSVSSGGRGFWFWFWDRNDGMLHVDLLVCRDHAGLL